MSMAACSRLCNAKDYQDLAVCGFCTTMQRVGNLQNKRDLENAANVTKIIKNATK